MAAQTVVVGAGLAGLSAAIHLAAAGRDVVVVEAEAGAALDELAVIVTDRDA